MEAVWCFWVLYLCCIRLVLSSAPSRPNCSLQLRQDFLEYLPNAPWRTNLSNLSNHEGDRHYSKCQAVFSFFQTSLLPQHRLFCIADQHPAEYLRDLCRSLRSSCAASSSPDVCLANSCPFALPGLSILSFLNSGSLLDLSWGKEIFFPLHFKVLQLGSYKLDPQETDWQEKNKQKFSNMCITHTHGRTQWWITQKKG